MDPLSTLPSIVQSEILVQLQSEISIKKIIQASPSMLGHFVTYKKSILRRIMNDILDGDTSGNLLRDALGIIYIQDKASAERYLEAKMWITIELPDTLEQDQLETLWRLFSRMITLIEDYVSKATSAYLPRAYLGIPDILNGSGSYFKGQRLDTEVVGFMSLTRTERHRFLSAFAKHELFCKIYHPLEGLPPPGEWSAMKEQLLAMSKDFDLSMINSVDEYYQGVYGALFAHCQESWLPDIPENFKTGQSSETNIPKSSRHALLFPDNTHFSAEVYEEDMEIYGRYLASKLPRFGLDFLSQILLFMKEVAGRGLILKAWLKTLPFRSHIPWTWLLPTGLAKKELRHYNRPLVNCNKLEGGESREHLGSTSFDKHQLTIYRQRARGLFDNNRLYPNYNNHFPTLEELAGEMKALNKMLAPRVERSRRRSQKWQDYWAMRTLEPPDQQCSEEDVEASTEGHVGPYVRFFEAMSSKLPVI
ncbi:hypothetical protein FPANT_13049 [Fusarium pseudoanthophilum]|uniref:Uncharacterized protein n=1 Tax=Fusarium pseudoanthophilum TaxID=48495 RepID=A0A8H5NMY6_9HYPO|nr:hypothetical protein FPANT_13049 [Fusarium pseudoanthophilum]